MKLRTARTAKEWKEVWDTESSKATTSMSFKIGEHNRTRHMRELLGSVVYSQKAPATEGVYAWPTAKISHLFDNSVKYTSDGSSRRVWSLLQLKME